MSKLEATVLRLTQAEKTLVVTFSNALSLNSDALNFEFGVIAKFHTPNSVALNNLAHLSLGRNGR